MEEKFKNWLIDKGYSEFTPSGSPSTVTDYCKRVKGVMAGERLSWQELAENINYYVNLYGPYGGKSETGKKSHNAVINALRAFERFLKVA